MIVIKLELEVRAASRKFLTVAGPSVKPKPWPAVDYFESGGCTAAAVHGGAAAPPPPNLGYKPMTKIKKGRPGGRPGEF
jgi:hypothetical protein